MSSDFEKFCGTPLFNGSSVYDSYADFEFCFEYTFLIWIPCFAFWLIFPAWIYMYSKQKNNEKAQIVKRTWLTYVKTILLIGLIAIEVTYLIYRSTKSSEVEIYPVYYTTPSILLVTYVGMLAIVHLDIKYNVKSSMYQLMFWFFLLIGSSFLLRRKIHFFSNELAIGIDAHILEFILYIEYYFFLFLMTILSLYSEKSIDPHNKQKKDIYPESLATIISRLTFWWVQSIIVLGHRRNLTKEDMWPLNDDESCKEATDALEREWSKAAEKYFDETKARAKQQAGFELSDEKKKNPIKEPSLFLCIVKAFGGKFLVGALFKLIQDLLIFAGPLILEMLIDFTKDTAQNSTVGYFYAVLLFFSATVQSIALQHYFHTMFIVGARIRTSLSGLIYKKCLKLSTAARKTATVGEMVNLLQVNTQSFVELTPYINMIWSSALQITICLVLLWRQIGVSTLVGLATMVIFIPLNGFVSAKAKKIQAQKLKCQDSRIKLTNEILNGIKVLKLYAWELSFYDILNKIRTGELGVLLKQGVYNVIITFSWAAASFLVGTASIICFILINSSNNLDPAKAFVSLTLFNIIRFPLVVLPQIITSMIQANVSMTRIKKYLLRDEIDYSQISHTPSTRHAVKFENVDLGWSAEETNLKDLNFKVKHKELVAVIGEVGSGKSSLLLGLLGEMYKSRGTINVLGKLSYVPQTAWIQNETLKNNITFGKEYDEALFSQVIQACALDTDINILPAGVATEIGEKGINLSGGQKQRVSLARAVYSDSELYLFDDPLSAVDAHVGKHIFDEVIGNKGILKDKTRIFVTNSLSFIPECDNIIFIEQGEIKEQGTYREIESRNGKAYEYIKHYFKNQDTRDKSEDQEEEAESKETKMAETKKPADVMKANAKKETEAINSNKDKIIVKENIETGQIKFSVVVDYFNSCGMVLSILFVVCYILMNVASAYTSVWLSDWSESSEKDDIKQRNIRLIGYSLIGISQYVFMLFGDVIFVKMTLKSSEYMHRSMLMSILRSTMQFFESTPTGRIINRFSKDIEAVETTIPTSYKALIRCMFQVLTTVIMISVATPYFLIALVPISIIYVFCQRYFVASMRQLRRLNSASKSPIFSHFGETLTGVNTIRAYQLQDRFVNLMNKKIDDNLLYFYPDTIANRWLALRLEFIGNLVTLFASIFAVVSHGSLSAGLAGLSISYSLNVSQFLNWLVRMSAEFESNIVSVERIKEYNNTPHEAEWTIAQTKPDKHWPAEGKIDFVDYSVKYREDLDNVLNNINLSIKSGEKIGVVGRTGAGKSSLTLGLFRILETNQGKILIDGIDIKNIGLHDLRKILTIIPQDPVLFSGTLKVNLDPFGTHTDKELWDALEQAHLKSFVEGVEKKLDFECSEGGENMSVGQRQLICLARALLRKTKILILDEATAAIDHNTDILIQKTIRRAFADCTIITIAHRLNTILDSTRILVLDKGRIAEIDTPESLLQDKNSIFHSMTEAAGILSTESN